MYQRLIERGNQPADTSYTASLLTAGAHKILKKVAEESAEVLMASVSSDKTHLTAEIADLYYHVMVLMINKGITPADVRAELEKRSALSGLAEKAALRKPYSMAVPKKGRIAERTEILLKKAGLNYTRRHRQDVAYCLNAPLMLVFLPAHDIPLYVGEGEIHYGITGQDLVAENDVCVEEVETLAYGICKLCVQAPKGKYADAEALAGKRVVTSFPRLAEQYFKTRELPIRIRTVNGSVEAACSLGLADAVVDLVESGETMEAAGLEALDTIMRTETVFIANPRVAEDEFTQILKMRFNGIKTAEQNVIIEYNIPSARLPDAVRITPGSKSPTVMDTGEAGWKAVKSLIPRADINHVIERISLLESFTLYNHTIRNRIVVPPSDGNAQRDGRVSHTIFEYYLKLAKQEAGTLILDNAYVAQQGKSSPLQLGISEEEHINGLKNLVKILTDEGVYVGIRFSHAGAKTNEKICGEQPVGPSEINFGKDYDNSREFDEDDAEEITMYFTHAIERAEEIGFHFVEVNAAQQMLFDQCINTRYNQRTDKYGGPMENRLRLLITVLDAMRTRVKGKIPISLFFSIHDKVQDKADPDFSAQDFDQFIRLLEPHVDFFHPITIHVMNKFFGEEVTLLEWIRNSTSKPLIAEGNIKSTSVLKEAIGLEKAEMYCLDKGLLSRPNWLQFIQKKITG
ncbi:hypothetical protein CHS0354_018350 [Potamilus streckersoni]|uniref:Phosphoribosyl-ATP diphosphatase n=1 Tax=Potamilus streckersoni TaxID=2493646 RepID=A0AAE0TAH6_9BIVA|nr:hypothetical protein CHS0354_018350 [Potamilus streckersoni]